MKRTTDAPPNLFESTRLGTVILIALAVWLGTAMLTAAGDPGSDARWRCSCPPDGTCTPNRATFGFFPTIWRRWPQPHAAAAEPVKKPSPSSRVEEKKKDEKTALPPTANEEEEDNPPAPPPEEPPVTEPAQPQTQTPTLAPEQPGTGAPGTIAPGAQPPKKGEPSQNENDPEKIFNESKKSPGATEGKPAEKADGDPFFDDKEEPAKPGGHSSSLRLPGGDQASASRWRANPIRRVAREQEVAPPADDDQPRLFQPTPSAKSIDDDGTGDDRDEPPAFEPEQSARPIEKTAFVQATTPSRTNPLRPATTPLSAPLSSPLRPSAER